MALPGHTRCPRPLTRPYCLALHAVDATQATGGAGSRRLRAPDDAPLRTLQRPVIVAAMAVIAASSAFLFLYAVNLLYLSWRATRLPAARAFPSTGHEGEGRVGVQLPIFHERYVAERVIDAACGLDWPRDRLEVQVLDDSDDDTPDIVERRLERWRLAGVAVSHVRRGHRAGYKAGALANGLTLTSAPFVA